MSRARSSRSENRMDQIGSARVSSAPSAAITNALRSKAANMATKASRKTYRAWLELEISVDPASVALPLPQRRKLFRQRIKNGLAALEQASPGIVKKLTSPVPGRSFSFVASFTADEIRAIWHVPELRFLADRDDNRQLDVKPDDAGRLPFIVTVQQHNQQEGSKKVEVHEMTLLIHSTSARIAKADALNQCRTMSAHVMDSDFRITKRWWTAQRAYLNTLREDEHGTIGRAIIIGPASVWPEKAGTIWDPKGRIERVTYGSPQQRPETWKWMLS